VFQNSALCFLGAALLQASFQALCGLQYLFWSTLGHSILADILGIYDKRLLMLWSSIGKQSSLTGGISVCKRTVFQLLCYFIGEARENCWWASSKFQIKFEKVQFWAAASVP